MYVGRSYLINAAVLFFCQYTAHSSRETDGNQMYSPGSAVGKASLIDPEISPIAPLIFTGVQNVRNWAMRSQL